MDSLLLQYYNLIYDRIIYGVEKQWVFSKNWQRPDICAGYMGNADEERPLCSMTPSWKFCHMCKKRKHVILCTYPDHRSLEKVAFGNGDEYAYGDGGNDERTT